MQFKGVKGYVIAALLMLVPSMAYFQKLRFEEVLKPTLENRVREVLNGVGVDDAEVTLHWMDAQISGRVKSVQRRAQIGHVIDELPGVRLAPGGNQLRADGWLQLARRNDEIVVTGLLPEGYFPELSEEAGRLVDRVERSEHVETPDAVLSWGEFLERYFGEVGDRTALLRDRRLNLSGCASPGLRSDWLSKASSVVGREQVDHHFDLYASIYHLPGYVPVSKLDRETREELQERLRASAIFFEPVESEVPASETAKISALATAILALGADERYLIGVLSTREAGSAAEMALWADRVAVVMRLLIGYGVRYEQFEVVDFSPIREGGRDHGVEILLK